MEINNLPLSTELHGFDVHLLPRVGVYPASCGYHGVQICL